jgi:hypothetical protein
MIVAYIKHTRELVAMGVHAENTALNTHHCCQEYSLPFTNKHGNDKYMHNSVATMQVKLVNYTSMKYACPFYIHVGACYGFEVMRISESSDIP